MVQCKGVFNLSMKKVIHWFKLSTQPDLIDLEVIGKAICNVRWRTFHVSRNLVEVANSFPSKEISMANGLM